MDKGTRWAAKKANPFLGFRVDAFIGHLLGRTGGGVGGAR